jgi:hypothetical protein
MKRSVPDFNGTDGCAAAHGGEPVTWSPYALSGKHYNTCKDFIDHAKLQSA